MAQVAKSRQFKAEVVLTLITGITYIKNPLQDMSELINYINNASNRRGLQTFEYFGQEPTIAKKKLLDMNIFEYSEGENSFFSFKNKDFEINSNMSLDEILEILDGKLILIEI